MQTKGSIKILPCRGLLLLFYEFMKLGGTYKMNIEMALKSKSIFLILIVTGCPLDFFFLRCLMERFFYQLSGSTFIFVKNTHPKAANLMFRLILPVAKAGVHKNINRLQDFFLSDKLSKKVRVIKF